MTDRRALRDAPRCHGIVDVSRAVLLVAQMTLLLENPKHRTHGRGDGRIEISHGADDMPADERILLSLDLLGQIV